MADTIFLPDTGTDNAVDIIEIHIKKGDEITAGQPIITLESDKATIDVPAPSTGKVAELLVKVGDKIKTGTPIFTLTQNLQNTSSTLEEKQTPVATITEEEKKSVDPIEKATKVTIAAEKPIPTTPTTQEDVLAGPAVRRLARLLGVDLAQINGSGERGRITTDNVRDFVKQLLTAPAQSSKSLGLPTMPEIDFAQFGPIETTNLTRIKRLTAENLSRNWLLAPHVTQFDEADITELEQFRKQQNTQFKQSGIKLTPLVFIMKAVVKTLQEFPQFNASLDQSGNHLIYKKYYHIGIAVDTKEGLVVPVIRQVDQKSITTLAKELAEISNKAREKKLTAQDFQGSSFTISSLGGIAGTGFTPIINLPNVAILGISKAIIKPHYDGQQFIPRLTLPLSLSYDHRVIDGAEAARFSARLTQCLVDIRLLLM